MREGHGSSAGLVVAIAGAGRHGYGRFTRIGCCSMTDDPAASLREVGPRLAVHATP